VPPLPARPTFPTPPAAPIPIEGERRQATVILADVKGSTALAEQVDTETWVEIMNDVLQVLAREIYRYGGQVDQFRGDGLVAFFGARTAHEDDPERAVRAALAMQAAVQAYAADLAERRGVELLLRVGVNTGEVIAASVGNARQHSEETAMGRAIALAARMESAAEPGTVLVTANTYRRVEPLFEWAALGQIRVKGVSRPLTAYRPLAARAVPGKLRGIAGLESPLVGRDAELTALQHAVDRLRAGLGGVVTLVGEAGLGKSRLVTEIRTSTEQQDGARADRRPGTQSAVRWVEGRCLSYTTNVAYQLWLDMLRAVLGVAPDAPSSAVRDALRERVQALCPERFDEVYPYLGRLLSVPLEAQEEVIARALTGESLKVITFRAVETLIRAAAERRPLVIVCEDLHWADPTSLELVERMLGLTDRVPLLLLCVFRPETTADETGRGCWRIRETAARSYRHRHTDLSLKPLNADESETLVRNLVLSSQPFAGAPALPRPLRERISAYAEGNPFYVEELIRSFIEAGTIDYDPATGRWQTVGDADAVALPETLHGVLMARIDRLPAEARRVLQLAAVIGRVFPHRVLEAIAPSPLPQAGGGPGGRALDDHLVSLQRAQMIRERARVPELEYIFKHHLTQEAAYNGLLARDRRAIHRQVAESLERLYAERLDERVELLAHHWVQAEEPDKAVGYLVKAGQRAARRYANQEALSYFQAALRHVPPGAEHDRILGYRARLYLNLFQGREAALDYRRLHERAIERGDREAETEALLGLGRAHYIIALDEPEFASSSLADYRRAYALAQERGDKARMVHALVPTPWFEDFWPPYGAEALENTQEALALSREIGDQTLITESMMAALRTNYADPGGQGEHITQRLEARHDLPRLNLTYFMRMWTHLFRGDFERGVELCDAGIRLAREIGVPPVQYPTLKALNQIALGRYTAARQSLSEERTGEAFPIGSAFQELGNSLYLFELMAYPEAAAVAADVIQRGKRIGRAWLSDWGRVHRVRSLIHAAPGERDKLERAIQDLETNLPASSTVRALGEPATVLGEVALARGDPERGLQHVQNAQAWTQENGCRPGYVTALELQTRILLHLDRPGDVVSLANEGIRMAEEMAYAPMLWRLRVRKARALQRLGRAGEARQAYKAAATVLLERADAIPETELRRAYLSSREVSSILAASRSGVGKENGT
jgi:class 3 adenylate cyclase/tetratricopeptide (TPR) repeat protein